MIQNFQIHIGTYKTGTTTIQQLLLKYESQLNVHDVYVIDRERDLPEVSKWLYPDWYGVEDLAKQETKAIHQILAVKKAVIAYENIVYSEENFTDVLSTDDQKARMKKLNFVIDMFSAKETTAHVFFREPASLLLSWYKQIIRNRNYNYPSYQAFVEKNLSNILSASDWDDYANRLQSSLGNVRLITHGFEKAAKNGLTKYFFEEALNMDSIKVTEESYNESQPDLTTRLLQSVSKLADESKLSKKNIGWLKKAVFEMEAVDKKQINKLSKEYQEKIQSITKRIE